MRGGGSKKRSNIQKWAPVWPELKKKTYLFLYIDNMKNSFGSGHAGVHLRLRRWSPRLSSATGSAGNIAITMPTVLKVRLIKNVI